MIVKDVSFGDSARADLVDGINILANAVKSTLGARGQTVLIESEHHTRGITVTKDGVTVANSINLMHPTQNLAVRMMKEAADNTATSAGDGTTTAIVLAQAIILEAMDRLKPHMSIIEVLRGIRLMSKRVVELLEGKSKKVSGRRLLDVATVSSNNDQELGKIISDAYSEVGADGVVTVENSSGVETFSEIILGMKVDRGYSSKYYITDHKKGECILEKPYILVADQEINHLSSIEHILEPIIKGGRSILIVGTVSASATNTLNLNVMKGNIKACSIIPPQFGWKSHELMEDISISTGAKYFSEDTGDNLEVIQMSDLGEAKRVIVGKDSTVIVTSDSSEQVIANRIAELHEMEATVEKSDEKDFIKERIAILGGGVGVVYVGAGSDIEQKEKRDRVDDAVCATKAALEGGILPGGGIALLEIASEIDMLGESESEKVAAAILAEAIQSPFRQILLNAGMDYKKIEAKLDKGIGYDVKNDEYGNMIKMGIIDPTKVTRTALENAVSVATTILSTNTIITNVRESSR
tara:strand:+ start:771 stop:2348 length:1578 start_codon:yes stop_codon:yes gene_type:complete